MKKLSIMLAVVLGFTANAIAGDKVIINGTENQPVAYGCATEAKEREECYAIPNGTSGDVIKWNTRYSKASTMFAQRDVYENSQVSILNGPTKGKVLFISHVYIRMK